MRWTESDEQALGRVQGRLQALVPGKSLSRPDVVRLLLHAAAGGVSAESLLEVDGRVSP